MCLYFRKKQKTNRKDDLFTNLFPEYEFDISQYSYLLGQSMNDVMKELNIYYPMMTFVIEREGRSKRSGGAGKNVFTLVINDRLQVVDIYQ